MSGEEVREEEVVEEAKEMREVEEELGADDARNEVGDGDESDELEFEEGSEQEMEEGEELGAENEVGDEEDEQEMEEGEEELGWDDVINEVGDKDETDGVEFVEESEEEEMEESEESGSDDAINEVGDADEFGEESEEEMEEGEELGADDAENEVGEEEGEMQEGNYPMVNAASILISLKEAPIDRLSTLPDILLFRILKRLDMKEAARTAELSRRWQFLWMESPWIKLRESSDDIEKIRRFVAGVNRILIIRNGKPLTNFKVAFTYHRCFALDVNFWIDSAVRDKVDKISLLLNSSSSEDSYRFPLKFFTNSTLTRLKLRGCVLAPHGTVHWPSLTCLYLHEMELPQNVIERILSGCPGLSKLLLRDCWGFNCLNVSHKLATLGLRDGRSGNGDPSLEISAPNAVYIIFIIKNPKGRQWRLTNIPSVVTAKIEMYGLGWDASSEEVMRYMGYLLEGFRHAKKLLLKDRIIQVLSKMAVNRWELPQSRRESLLVHVLSDTHSISGIVALLESSPNLETLFLFVRDHRVLPVLLGPAVMRDLDCELLHLKSIYMSISPDPAVAGNRILKLVEILLKRATVLKDMVIDVEHTTDVVEVIQTLLAYPRSSKNARVFLRNPTK